MLVGSGGALQLAEQHVKVPQPKPAAGASWLYLAAGGQRRQQLQLKSAPEAAITSSVRIHPSLVFEQQGFKAQRQGRPRHARQLNFWNYGNQASRLPRCQTSSHRKHLGPLRKGWVNSSPTHCGTEQTGAGRRFRGSERMGRRGGGLAGGWDGAQARALAHLRADSRGPCGSEGRHGGDDQSTR
jgi:hypothetical protein